MSELGAHNKEGEKRDNMLEHFLKQFLFQGDAKNSVDESAWK